MGSTLALTVINGVSSRDAETPDSDNTGIIVMGHCASRGDDDVNRLTYFANRLDPHYPLLAKDKTGRKFRKRYVWLGRIIHFESQRLNRDGKSKVSAKEITSVISFASNLNGWDSSEGFSLAHVRCCSIWFNNNLKTLLMGSFTRLDYYDTKAVCGIPEIIGIYL